jgi:hypothetical protein
MGGMLVRNVPHVVREWIEKERQQNQVSQQEFVLSVLQRASAMETTPLLPFNDLPKSRQFQIRFLSSSSISSLGSAASDPHCPSSEALACSLPSGIATIKGLTRHGMATRRRATLPDRLGRHPRLRFPRCEISLPAVLLESGAIRRVLPFGGKEALACLVVNGLAKN